MYFVDRVESIEDSHCGVAFAAFADPGTPCATAVEAGTLDLTASNLIVNDLAMHARIGTCARQIKRVVDVGRGQLKFGAAVEALMQLLHSIHAIWRTKTRLTADQCAAYHPGPSKEREGLLPKPLLGSAVGV